jgi:5-enolpyruvylshikimate-3-phosphate synthase
MNWLLKKLGYRDRKYRAADFSVTIEPGFREIVSVMHERGGASLHLDGERIGKKWEGISVHIPEGVDKARVAQIARDLETAFQALGYGYIIARLAGIEIVSESEQQAAITELNSMGINVEVSPDRKQIRQSWKHGAPRLDKDTARKQAPRIMSLIQALHGKRQRFETLARSSQFRDPPEEALLRDNTLDN